MTRITAATHPVQVADLGKPPDLDVNQARQWLSQLDPEALPLMIAARLNGLASHRTAQEALLTAAFERAQGKPTLLADLRHMAQVRHFDPAKLAPAATQKIKDRLVTQRKTGGKARRTLRDVMTGRRDPQVAAGFRAAVGQTAAGEGQLARWQLERWVRAQELKGPSSAFFTEGQHNLQALGKLRPGEVAATLRAAGAPPQLLERLQASTFQALRDGVISSLRQKVSDTLLVVTCLAKDPAARQALLTGSRERAPLAQELRGLGIAPQLAAQIAQPTPQQAALLARGLKEATVNLEALATFAARASVNDLATLELYELARPLWDELQQTLLIRPDSFARQALDRGLDSGRAERALNKAGRRLCTVTSSLVAGVISGGTSLIAQMAGSLGAAAVSGLPDLAQKAAKVRQATASEGLEAAATGTTARALQQQQHTEQGYLTSMANAALAAPAGMILGTMLSESTTECLDQLEPVAPSSTHP